MLSTRLSWPPASSLAGVDHEKVVSYLDVLRDKAPVGQRVAIIGAGGIGFDVAEFLTHSGASASQDPEKFYNEWGIDTDLEVAGGLKPAVLERSPREIHLLQRKASKIGDQLGKTTGWIHRTSLKARGVKMWTSVGYQSIDNDGLHVDLGGAKRTLEVDAVVICAGQESLRELASEMEGEGIRVHLIGGAREAGELDAKRAILEGMTLAASI